jgi:hypothetical protein
MRPPLARWSLIPNFVKIRFSIVRHYHTMGNIEIWTMETNYPVMHDYFFANPNVDAYVVKKLLSSYPPPSPS